MVCVLGEIKNANKMIPIYYIVYNIMFNNILRSIQIIICLLFATGFYYTQQNSLTCGHQAFF